MLSDLNTNTSRATEWLSARWRAGEEETLIEKTLQSPSTVSGRGGIDLLWLPPSEQRRAWVSPALLLHRS